MKVDMNRALGLDTVISNPEIRKETSRMVREYMEAERKYTTIMYGAFIATPVAVSLIDLGTWWGFALMTLVWMVVLILLKHSFRCIMDCTIKNIYGTIRVTDLIKKDVKDEASTALPLIFGGKHGLS